MLIRSVNWLPSGRTDLIPRSHRRIARLVTMVTSSILIGVTATACASIGPKPWERDLMAKPEMQFNTHPLITAANLHIYFSKEASSGGSSFAGGGCGCN